MDIVTFKKEFSIVIVGAVIFIASFLWKDFLGDVEDLYFPRQDGLWSRFVFVFIMTIVLISVAVYLKGVFGLTGVTDIRFDDGPLGNTDVSVEEFENRSKKLKYG